MTSLYSKYIDERAGDLIIEMPWGFASYRYLNDDQVYIIDIYVIPEERKSGKARSLTDAICSRAKEKGCKELIGTVNPSCKGANESILTLLAYGMKVIQSKDNCIIFKKDL